SAANVMETVVERRASVLDPPVAADDPVVAVAHAGIRGDPVHHRLDPELTRRGRLVSLVLLLRDAVSPEVCRPGAVDSDPAVARFPPEAEQAGGRPGPRRDDGDQLGRRAS